MPYIVFEGIDGSGTTTQSKRLASKLGGQWTNEPTEGLVGRFVREIFEKKHGDLPNWKTMFHLFQADREMHYEKIREWLRRKRFVVADRSWMSSLTYQVTSAEMHGANSREVEELIQLSNEGAPKADVTFILDVPAVEALSRKKKEPDHYAQRDYLELVRMKYLKIGGTQVRRIDTTGKGVDEVAAEIDMQLAECGF